MSELLEKDVAALIGSTEELSVFLGTIEMPNSKHLPLSGNYQNKINDLHKALEKFLIDCNPNDRITIAYLINHQYHNGAWLEAAKMCREDIAGVLVIENEG